MINKEWIKEKIKYILNLGLSLLLLYILIEKIGMIYGIIVFAVFYVIFMIIRQRQSFMYSIEYIETQIFGKPLNKKYWKNEKLPKIRFVFNKNKVEMKDEKRT